MSIPILKCQPCQEKNSSSAVTSIKCKQEGEDIPGQSFSETPVAIQPQQDLAKNSAIAEGASEKGESSSDEDLQKVSVTSHQ